MTIINRNNTIGLSLGLDQTGKQTLCLELDKLRFRIGIAVLDISKNHNTIAAAHHAASACTVTSMAILSGSSERASVDKWFQQHRFPTRDMEVLWGMDGFHKLVARHDIDAVYIIVPTSLQPKLVLAALEGEKHVLVNDPVSTSLTEFREQLACAHRVKKFVQFATMFFSIYRVQKLMDAVLSEQKFGQIQYIHACLTLSYKDLASIGVNLPLRKDEGCIKKLGRFCVLFGVLMFRKVGSNAVSVQTHQADILNNGEQMSSECTVLFSDNRKLTFNVEYANISATRQTVEVHSDLFYATMTDFVFPHPDGWANYRVYQKRVPSAAASCGRDTEVLSGKAVEVMTGPPQNAMMWRNFRQLSRLVDEVGFDANTAPEPIRELTDVSIQTKKIMIALTTSTNQGFIVVKV